MAIRKNLETVRMTIAAMNTGWIPWQMKALQLLAFTVLLCLIKWFDSQ